MSIAMNMKAGIEPFTEKGEKGLDKKSHVDWYEKKYASSKPHIFTKQVDWQEWTSYILLLQVTGGGLYYALLEPIRMPVFLCISFGLAYSILLLYQVYKRIEVRKIYFIWLISLICVGSLLTGLGVWQVKHSFDTYQGDTVYFYRTPGIYSLVVTSVPQVIERDGRLYYHLTGQLKALQPDKEADLWLPAFGCITVDMLYQGQELQIGDNLYVKGVLNPLSLYKEEGEIDRQARAVSSQLIGRMYDASLVSNQGLMETDWLEMAAYKWQRFFANRRADCQEILFSNLPSEEAPLAQSLLLGADYNDLEGDMVDRFSTTGLIHILSVSGSHISLLLGGFLLLGRSLGLSKKKAILIALTGLGFYCALVGFSPPVIRASLMGLLGGIGLFTSRTYAIRQALVISALISFWINPLAIFDISFQLSFLATLGIVLFGQIFYQRLPLRWSWLKGLVSLSLSAQVLLLPLQLYYFHMWGLGTLLTSIFVAPLLDMAIILLAGALFLTFFGFPWAGWFFITWILEVALFMLYSISSLPYMTLWLPALPLGAIVAYYMGCFSWPFMVKKVRNQWSFFLTCVFCLTCLVGGCLWQLYRSTSFLHVIPIQSTPVFFIREAGFVGKTLLYLPADTKRVRDVDIKRIVSSLRSYGLVSVDEYRLGKADEAILLTAHKIQEALASGWDASSQRQRFYKADTIVKEAGKNKKGDVEGKEMALAIPYRLIKSKIIYRDESICLSWYNKKSKQGWLQIEIGDNHSFVYWPSIGQTNEFDPADDNTFLVGKSNLPGLTW